MPSFLFSQNPTDLFGGELSDDSQIQNERGKVLKACELLFSTPMVKKDADRGQAGTLIVKWMESTPDYSFVINDFVHEMTKGKENLMQLYLAALVKATLESANPYEDQEDIQTASMHAFLNYCIEPSNNVKPTKEMRRALDAREAGRLSEYLAMK
jgi:hypothetical protein